MVEALMVEKCPNGGFGGYGNCLNAHDKVRVCSDELQVACAALERRRRSEQVQKSFKADRFDRNFLFTLNPDDMALFADIYGFCAVCGARLVDRTEQEGEHVCPSCGSCFRTLAVENKIPFEESAVESGHAESSYNPGCSLAWDNGLGGVMKPKDLYRVLGKAPAGKRDIFLRMSMTRVQVQCYDHPIIAALLAYCSGLCNQFGLHTDKHSHIIFAMRLGRAIRNVGAYYVFRREKWGQLERVAQAVFCVVHQKMFGYNDGVLMGKLGFGAESKFFGLLRGYVDLFEEVDRELNGEKAGRGGDGES